MIPIETTPTTTVTLTTAPEPLTTQAPLQKNAPQTNCDGVGTFSCQTGTCYTGQDRFIGCCSVSSCAARTTCYSYDSASSTSCDPNTGGCLSCQQAYPYCVTLTNILEDQYIIYCSTRATTITLSYTNLITTGSTASTTPASTFPTPSSASSTSYPPTPSSAPSSTSPPPPATTLPAPQHSHSLSTGALIGLILGPLLFLLLLLILLILLYRLLIFPRRRLAFAGGLSHTHEKPPRGTLGGAMLPPGRWDSPNLDNPPNESPSHDPFPARPNDGLGITTPGSAPWSPSSLSPYPDVGELHDEPLSRVSEMPAQSPISDTSNATARYGLEGRKTAAVAGDAPSPSVFELAASEPRNPHPRHLSVPVSELSASSSPLRSEYSNPHASMPVSDMEEEEEGVGGVGSGGAVEGRRGRGRLVSPETGAVGGWWVKGGGVEEEEEEGTGGGGR